MTCHVLTRLLHIARCCIIAGVLGCSLLTSSCEHSVSPTLPRLTAADTLALIRETFNDPQECGGCHPDHYQEWQTSMHAYAFMDPLFFVLNDIGQQRSNQQLDQFCVKCHSPVAPLLGETPPGFDRSMVSEIAQKGITCDVCHSIDSFKRGQGVGQFRLDQVKQGPIMDGMPNDFHESTFDRRYNKSTICTPCHDVTNPEGVQVEFTSTEWDNSPYSAMGLECQGCHMPSQLGQAAIAGPQRIVHKHTFVGVDVPLVDFPDREGTIELVSELLRNSVTMEVTAPAQVVATDDIPVAVRILNDKTGHDIPTGTTFERQMWIEIIVQEAGTGDVVYSSGTLDANGDLHNHHSEMVQSGAEPADADLALFHGTPMKSGQEIMFFWEADEIENHTIPAFESRTATYSVPGPIAAAAVDVSVRLRFRAFAPYFLRAIGQDQFIAEIPVFEMEEFQQRINITQ